jgi:anaerobic magnesium-protoporphyrin IX monomethyl ester cyclase
MRAVVAAPPIHDFYFTPHRYASLGAQVVAEILTNKNIKVCLFNFPARGSKTLPLPAPLGYLEPFIIPEEQGKCSFFTKYQHFGPPFDLCVEKILASKPDIIFLSCFAFCYADQALQLARSLKKAAPAVPLAMGGAGANAYPGYFLKEDGVDFLFCGEAELNVPLLAEALISGSLGSDEMLSTIPGLLWKTKEGIQGLGPAERFTGPQDLTPTLTLALKTKKALYFSTVLSRGCPRQCRFCSTPLSMGRAWRHVDYQVFSEHAAVVLADHAAQGKQLYLNFEDDNFLLDTDGFLALCSGLRARFPALGFLAENGLDYRELTVEKAQRLIDAGFCKFNISLAAVDDAAARDQARETDLGHYQNIAAFLALKNIPLTTYFICGLPGDSVQTIARALALLASQPTRVGISPFYAVPGMPDFQDLTVFFKISSNLACGSSCFPWASKAGRPTGSVSTPAIVTAFRLSRFINLCKQEALSPLEKELVRTIKKEKRLYTIVGNRKSVAAIVPVENMDQELVDIFFRSFP